MSVAPANDVNMRVLMHAPTRRDGEVAQRLLASAGIEVVLHVELANVLDALAHGAGAVMLTEESLSTPMVDELRRFVLRQPPWSEIPLLLLVASGRGHLLEHQIGALGSVTLLERPVLQRTLLSAVQTALRARRRQYQVRDQMIERELLLERERAAREEAERVGRMKDEFLATLSHELRTPLSAILGWSQVLARAELGEHDVREGLQVIERNARAQTRLIEDLLDMSRIVSGKLRLDVQAVDVGDVLRAALETVGPAVEAKEIALDVRLDPDCGPVSGDASRLQQVVWNLLSNAVKFTPRCGRVDIELRRVGSQVELSVRDTGQGIPPEFLPHLFERFRQADSSTTRRHGGLGLGLAIVKHLVELHGGTVRAESDGPDRGSTFTITLPIAAVIVRAPFEPAVRPADAPLGAATGFKPTLRGLDVIVVDDESDARRLLDRVLRACGALVRTSESAADALRQIEERVPDVLISDIGMPGMDGYELLRRARTAVGRVDAIALSAFVRPEDRARALSAGYRAHLSKPVEVEELIATVTSVARRE